MHYVDAEVARPHLADKRIHIGAIHVEQRTFGVENVCNLVDLVLEDAEGRRVGEHERSGCRQY